MNGNRSVAPGQRVFPSQDKLPMNPLKLKLRQGDAQVGLKGFISYSLLGFTSQALHPLSPLTVARALCFPPPAPEGGSLVTDKHQTN